jgi:hypothetical protein
VRAGRDEVLEVALAHHPEAAYREVEPSIKAGDYLEVRLRSSGRPVPPQTRCIRATPARIKLRLRRQNLALPDRARRRAIASGYSVTFSVPRR